MSKRIEKELAEFAKNPPAWCKVKPQSDSVFHWKATLLGPVRIFFKKII